VFASYLAFGAFACHSASESADTDSANAVRSGGAAGLGPELTLGDLPSGSSPIPASLLAKWDALRSLPPTPEKLQPGCEPMRYSPPPGTAYRGIAVMLHGFSACSQQYDVLGPQMAKAGYEVFIPVHPGHGAPPKVPAPGRIDDVSLVPFTADQWTGYAQTINEIAGFARGEKVLVGLSQGSNVALRAIELAPQLYDKAMLYAPKLRTEASFLNNILFNDTFKLMGADDLLNLRSGWSKCEGESAPFGSRAGFCNFQNRHAVAMFKFGDAVIDTAASLKGKGIRPKTSVQFVFSHYDDGACNDAALSVQQSFRATGASSQTCVMAKGVPHAMISRHDSPKEPKPWMPGLFRATEQFLVSGTPLPGSTTSAIAGDCRL